MAYPTTPKTWSSGDVLTAAQMNAELRDALLAIFPLGPPDGAWTSYTPTLTQSGAVTKTATYAKYQRVGRLIVAQCLLTCTGPGTASNQIIVGLPVPAAQAALTMPVGTFYVRNDSTATFFTAAAMMNAAGALIGIPNGANNSLGVTSFTAALANLDTVGYAVVYEAAS